MAPGRHSLQLFEHTRERRTGWKNDDYIMVTRP